MRVGVHTGYDNGNFTQMGANGFKVFKILTFGPIKKYLNLTF
jgi:hypothetical protein